jgi:hypothetical protein
MGHGVPNTIGVDIARMDDALFANVPAYSEMGEMGSGEMGMGEMGSGEMGMGDMRTGGDGDSVMPANSLPMMGSRGPHGIITMSGMFTILKVRETLEDGVEPGWYAHPPGTQAVAATAEQLERDGIDAT